MILPEVSTLDIDVPDDLTHVGLCRLRVFCEQWAKETRISDVECHGAHRSPLYLLLPKVTRIDPVMLRRTPAKAAQAR